MSKESAIDRRTPQKGDRRRASLLRALDGLIHERGIDDIAISDITTRAGVTRSAFYFYFENKAMAVAALMADMYDDAFQASAVLNDPSMSPRARIECMIRALLESWQRRESMFRAMLDARQTSTVVREIWDRDRSSFVEPVAAMIDAERASGRASDGPPSAVLATLLLELNDRALERLSLGSPMEFDDFVQGLTTIWHRTVYGRDA